MSSRLACIALRVSSASESAEYLCKHFAMKIIDRVQSPEAIVVGYPQGAHIRLLTTNADALMIGEGYGHLALTAPNIYDTCAHIKSDGGKVTREPGPVKGGTTEIAFVEAPGGWKYELIKRSDDWKCPMLHLMLRVGDLDRTSNFYEQVFGLSTLRESVNEAYKYTLRFVGPGREEDHTVFEFTYNWGKTEYNLGNAHAYTEMKMTAVKVEEVYKKIESTGGKIVAKTNDGFVCTDPDGYTLKVSSE